MLSVDGLRVWRLRLDAETLVAAERMEASKGILSAEEARRAATFRFAEQRREYTAAHVGLRMVLGECLGVSPSSVPLDGEGEASVVEGNVQKRLTIQQGGASTKPRIVTQKEGGFPGGKNIRFNLSHTGGMALIGVGSGFEVGVDVERLRPMEDLDAIAHSVMSHNERSGWDSLPSGEKLHAFYRVWTRKEAYLKAIGLGLYRNLQDVTVPLQAELGDASGAALLVSDRTGGSEWMVRDVPIPEGYAASICWERFGDSDLSVMDLNLTDG